MDVSNVTLRGSSNTDNNQPVEEDESKAQQSEGNSTTTEEKSGFTLFLEEFFEGTAGYDTVESTGNRLNMLDLLMMHAIVYLCCR